MDVRPDPDNIWSPQGIGTLTRVWRMSGWGVGPSAPRRRESNTVYSNPYLSNQSAVKIAEKIWICMCCEIAAVKYIILTGCRRLKHPGQKQDDVKPHSINCGPWCKSPGEGEDLRPELCFPNRNLNSNLQLLLLYLNIPSALGKSFLCIVLTIAQVYFKVQIYNGALIADIYKNIQI